MRKEQKEVEQIKRLANKYLEQDLIDQIRSNGQIIEVYFDTYYILAMIQGYWEIRIGQLKDIDTKAFNDDKFLVKSLAYLGYIKNIKILLPHAVELKNQLDKTYLLPDERISKDHIDYFLEEIKLDKLSKLKSFYENNELEKYLQKLTPRTEDIFKANYVLSQLDWEKRYKFLFNGKNHSILSYDLQKYDKIKILESKLFHQVYEALTSDEREFKTVNNLRDAMALCIFNEKIKKYRNDKKVLPLFYVTNDVISKLGELINEFTVEIPEKGKIVLLKDTEYFIIDAIFSRPGNTEKDSQIFSQLNRIKEFTNIYEEIESDLPKEEIHQIVKSLKQYKENDFFNKIWDEKHGSRDILNENIRNLLEYDFLIENSENVRKLINSEREKIRMSIDDSVGDFIFLEQLWKSIDLIPEYLEKVINKESQLLNEMSADIFRDEGLTRFSLPQGEVERQIKEIWKEFLENYKASGVKIRAIKVKLTKIIYEGTLEEENDAMEKVLVGISILFVFHRYDLIISIVEHIKNIYKCRHILFIYVACLIKVGSRSVSRLKKIEGLLNYIDKEYTQSMNYKNWISISFLKFNYWSLRTNGEFRYEEANRDERYDQLAIDAIRLSKEAYHYLLDSNEDIEDDELKSEYRSIKLYYALNNYIYYSVCAGNDKLVESDTFFRYVKKLMKIQEGERFEKQSRFNDTLASYFYRRAIKSQVPIDQKLKFLEIAEELSLSAQKNTVLKDNKFNTLYREIEIKKLNISNEKDQDRK